MSPVILIFAGLAFVAIALVIAYVIVERRTCRRFGVTIRRPAGKRRIYFRDGEAWLEFHGVLDELCETGTEGLIWILDLPPGRCRRFWRFLRRRSFWSYADMIEPQKGQHLTVYAPDGRVLFDGIIDPDRKAGYQPYPMNPDYGQPCAFGFWIHWTQRGWEPEAWARLFLWECLKDTPEDQRRPLRAVLRCRAAAEDLDPEEDEEEDLDDDADDDAEEPDSLDDLEWLDDSESDADSEDPGDPEDPDEPEDPDTPGGPKPPPDKPDKK